MFVEFVVPALPALVRQRIENADAKQTRSGPGVLMLTIGYKLVDPGLGQG